MIYDYQLFFHLYYDNIRSPEIMPVETFCKFNSFCALPKCRQNHHRPIEERTLLLTIINQSPEIADFKEDIDPSRKVPCKHGLRCFEKDCGFHHGLNHDGRKILTKKFNKEWKGITIAEKIKNEIEEIGLFGMRDWNDYV